MKTLRAMIGCCALVGAAFLAARADDKSAAATPTVTPAPLHPPTAATLKTPSGPMGFLAPSTGEAPIDSADYSTMDPEQVAAETYLANKERQAAPDYDAIARAEKQKAYDNDWLLRDYMLQLKQRGLVKNNYDNPYLIDSPANSSRSLAPDPLLPATTRESRDGAQDDESSIADDPLLAPLNGEKKKHQASSSLADDDADSSSTTTPAKKSLTPLAFQPLIAPLDQPVALQRNPFTAHSDAVSENLGLTQDPGTSLLPVPGSGLAFNRTEPGDVPGSLMDVPGLTGAQGGIARDNSLDFADPATESPERARERMAGNNFMVPTSPTNDVTEFFKKQSEALLPPAAPTAMRPMTVAAPPSLPEVPKKLVLPRMSGIRSHVDDPFDILNR